MQSNEIFALRLLIIVECGAAGTLALLFPASSVLQLVGSISVPVEVQAKDQRLFFDWGFQMNYVFPSNLSEFYNAPIWRSRLERDIVTKHVDYTSSEFYYGLASFLKSFSYQESCLLRAVCELAQHPFDVRAGDFLSEFLHFILTPSLHQQQFSESAQKVHHAEIWGKEGGIACGTIYASCEVDLLSFITKVQFD